MKYENKFLAESEKHARRRQKRAIREWSLAISLVLTTCILGALHVLTGNFEKRSDLWYVIPIAIVCFYSMVFYAAKEFALAEPMMLEQRLRYLYKLRYSCPACDSVKLEQAIDELVKRKRELNRAPVTQ